MSKWIEEIGDGKYKAVLADQDECKHMYDMICCNDQSEWCCEYPGEDCEKCKLFEPEDMA